MLDVWKKAGVIFGHAICIFILLYSFASIQETDRGEEKELHTVELPEHIVMPTLTVLPALTATPVAEITKSPIMTPTVTPEPTLSPTPTATLAPTPASTATPTPTATLTPMPTATPIPTVGPEEERAETKNQVIQNIADRAYASLDNKSDNWWFRRKTEHVPSGSGEFFKIDEYQGFYRNKAATEEDKVLYLTIDCGYGSSNTTAILDTFKKHDIKVTFFVTGFFLKACPEEVKRMVEEGHVVANHSVSHANLTSLSEEEIYAEIIGCEEAFYELTGTQMALFFRPPEGAYSKRTMQLTEDLGYKTIFWSIAYNDYDKNNQPGKDYVLDHFMTYHHNGAIPLMHNDSDSNMEAMDEVITFLKEQGYRFGTLDELK